MTPYARKFISNDDSKTFERVRELVLNLPDLDFGESEEGKGIILSCHMLAIAIAKFLNLEVVHGYFCSMYQHSWVVTPTKHIIDVYPIGILGGPIMIDGMDRSPVSHLYNRATLGINFETESFKRSVEKICRVFSGA